MAETVPVVAKGLAGIIALESVLSSIDGEAGKLVYRGYDIFDLAENATFEEVSFLLWRGELPNASELRVLKEAIQSEMTVPESVLEALRLIPADIDGMAALRTGVSLLGNVDPDAEDDSPEANYRKSIRLTARTATVLAALSRMRRGLDVIAPKGTGSLAGEFLYMVNGEWPGEESEKTFDTCLVLHADHGLNASTFTGRVIGSTLSDIYSAVVGAIGALKGPLHGGANIAVMKTLLSIDQNGTDPEVWVREKLANKEKIMGFGHRVYRTMDPRGAILRDIMQGVAEETGGTKWVEMQRIMMDTMVSEKGIYPNVDFFSAPLYYMLGIDIDLYTPIFAMSRMAGWTANLLEQWEDNRLIRPRAAYVGPVGRTVKPLSER